MTDSKVEPKLNEDVQQKKKGALLKNILQLLLFIGLGVFFVWLSFRGIEEKDWIAIKESLAGINNPRSWIFLTFSLLSGAIAHFFRAMRSILLIDPLGYKVRASMSFYAVMVCYLGNLAFPRLGEILRCTFLQRYEKVPFQKSLGTIVAERALDVVIWLPLFLLVIIMNTSLLSDLVVDKATGQTLGMSLENTMMSMLTNVKMYIAIAAVVIAAIVIYLTRKKWMKVPFFVKVKDVLVGIWQGLISIKDVKKPWLFILYTALIWVFYFLGTYLCFFAFDFLAHLGPAPAFSVLIFGTIGFMIAQGGIGAYPLIVAGILVLYNIDYAPALAAGWVGWSVQTAMIIIFGLASLILASLTKRKES
ncbi:flippase-like domain-containing protein [Bacteroidales bacterium OttesenSCG-928-E04]|nr:flippase-like domain-containing protein [Bacteroidales bacterium OttesenSCG-928-E04]